jgi:glutathione S-transferase
MGKVPVLIDGDVILTESTAIVYYLARREDSPLWPASLVGQARALQWTSWAITELEFYFTLIVRELRRAGASEPNQALIAECMNALGATMGALEAWLSRGNAYVAGADFSIGDINAAFPAFGAASRLDMSRFPAVADWLKRCGGRPAWQRVMAIDETALAA